MGTRMSLETRRELLEQLKGALSMGQPHSAQPDSGRFHGQYGLCSQARYRSAEWKPCRANCSAITQAEI